MTEIEQSDIWNASNQWIESAVLLGIGLRVSPLPKDAWATYYHLLVMCRAQFAAEFSYERFIQNCDTTDLAGIMRGYLDLHSFLVSAHLYWRTLRELASDFNLPELAQSVSTYSTVIDNTKCARDHIEHISERIESGRSERWGDSMDTTVFRRRIGNYSDGSVTFGDETINLHEIYDAIRAIGRTVAPKLRALVNSGFKVKFTTE